MIVLYLNCLLFGFGLFLYIVCIFFSSFIYSFSFQILLGSFKFLVFSALLLLSCCFQRTSKLWPNSFSWTSIYFFPQFINIYNFKSFSTIPQKHYWCKPKIFVATLCASGKKRIKCFEAIMSVTTIVYILSIKPLPFMNCRWDDMYTTTSFGWVISRSS